MKNYNKRMKMKNVEKIVTSLHDKTEYFIDIKNLNQTLNHRWTLKKLLEWLNLIKILG